MNSALYLLSFSQPRKKHLLFLVTNVTKKNNFEGYRRSRENKWSLVVGDPLFSRFSCISTACASAKVLSEWQIKELKLAFGCSVL